MPSTSSLGHQVLIGATELHNLVALWGHHCFTTNFSYWFRAHPIYKKMKFAVSVFRAHPIYKKRKFAVSMFRVHPIYKKMKLAIFVIRVHPISRWMYAVFLMPFEFFHLSDFDICLKWCIFLHETAIFHERNFHI